MKKELFLALVILIFPAYLRAEDALTSNDKLELEKLIRQKDYLRTRIYELVEENKTLAEKMKVLEDKAGSCDDVIGEHKGLIVELQNTKNKLEQDVKDLEDENNKLLTTLQDKEGFIQNVETNFEGQLKQESEVWKKQLDQKDQELAQVKDKIILVEASLKKTEEELDLVRGNFTKLQEEKKLLTDKNDFLVNKMVEIENESQQVKLGSEEKVQQISQENQDLKKELDELTSQNKNLSKTISDLENKFRKMEPLVQKADEAENLKLKLAEIQEQFAKIQKDHEESLKEIATLTREKDFLARKGKEVLEQNRELETRLANNTKTGDIQTTNVQKESNSDEKWQDEIAMLKKQLIEKDAEINKKASSKTDIQNREAVSSLELKLKSLEEANKVLTKEQEKQIKEWRDEIVRLKDQLEEEKELAEKKEEFKSTLEAKLQNLETQNKALLDDKNAMEKQNTELVKNKESLMNELSSFSDRYKTLEEKFEQISKAAVRNQELITKEVERARKPLEDINKALEKRVSDLNNMVEKTSATLSELVDKGRETELSNRSFREENKKLNEKIALLETDLKKSEENLQVQLKEVRTPLDGKILFLEEKLKKMDETSGTVQNLTGEREKLKSELESLNEKNIKLTKDLEAVNDLLQETDSFLARKVQEATLQKDQEIESLKKKLGITAEVSAPAHDVLLKDK